MYSLNLSVLLLIACIQISLFLYTTEDKNYIFVNILFPLSNFLFFSLGDS